MSAFLMPIDKRIFIGSFLGWRALRVFRAPKKV
nr:MAG TPA: hypothetical protein [Caudoviricetes sp.]